MNTAQTLSAFEQRFDTSPEVVIRSPGRVNLIGDHTDYNEGFVLPIAIDRSILVAIRGTNSQHVEVHSDFFDQTVQIPVREDSGDAVESWSQYIVGVLAMLRRQQIPLTGLQMWIGGDLPPGAGLASSAALEVGVARGLLELAGRRMSPVALATMCRAAESEFAGSPCGIMDQLCCTSATANHALFIDCRSMTTQQIPLSLDDAVIVVIDSGVRHEIAHSQYAERRRECAAALDALRSTKISIRSLRDVTLQSMPGAVAALDGVLARRVRHVVTENARVAEAVSAMREGDLVSLGWLMTDSHESLRDDYEVSCKELDTLVTIATEIEGVFGARMTGGGFGGCAVAVVAKNAVEELTKVIQKKYNGRFKADAQVFPVQSVARAEAVEFSTA